MDTFSNLIKNRVSADAAHAAGIESAAAVSAMQAHAALVNPSIIPASNPNGFAGLARAVALSAGYLKVRL